MVHLSPCERNLVSTYVAYYDVAVLLQQEPASGVEFPHPL
jgi:hypothetical protein